MSRNKTQDHNNAETTTRAGEAFGLPTTWTYSGGDKRRAATMTLKQIADKMGRTVQETVEGLKEMERRGVLVRSVPTRDNETSRGPRE